MFFVRLWILSTAGSSFIQRLERSRHFIDLIDKDLKVLFKNFGGLKKLWLNCAEALQFF